MGAADAAEAGDRDALATQRLLLGFRDPAYVAVERFEIRKHDGEIGRDRGAMVVQAGAKFALTRRPKGRSSWR